MDMLVKEIMRSPVVTVDRDASVRKAAQVMNEAEVGSVIVCTDNKGIGIVTERDILKFIAKGGDAKKTKVSEIVSKPLIVVSPETDLEEAVKFMIAKKIKKLPVVDQGRLVGIFTLTDVARIEPLLMKALKSLIAQGLARKFEKYIKPSYIA